MSSPKYVNFSSCSILPKNNEYARSSLNIKEGQKVRRWPVAVFGKFKNKQEFNQALLEALDDQEGEVWDLRTVKFHDNVGFPLEAGNVISLEYLYEDT